MDKQKKKLMWTILIVAIIQMPGLALTPGINQIRTTAFPGYSLSAVQTAISITSLAQPIAALAAAVLVNRRIVSKKGVITFGLILLAADGLLAIFMHTQFWHLITLSLVLGCSTGCFVSNMFGLIFDNYDPVERQLVAGYQTSFINAGGIMMSLLGGLLARYMWYGGYLVLFVGIPAAALVSITVTKQMVPAVKRENKKALSRLNPIIYYYVAINILFMMCYSACGSNLSTHIAGIGDTSTAGVAFAFQMLGGVISGIFYGRLSKKIGDFSIPIALCAVFIGFIILSLFPTSLILIFVAVFIVGLALSIVVPRCIVMVSIYADDPSTAATATALVATFGPSMGTFLSPIIITNLTTALFGESTSARYAFLGCFVLLFAAAIALITMHRNKKAVSAA